MRSVLDADQWVFVSDRKTGRNCPGFSFFYSFHPSVLWLKNSAKLLGSLPGSSVLDEGSLVIGSVLPSDSGEYTCLATNEAGSVQRRTKLVHLSPPPVPSVLSVSQALWMPSLQVVGLFNRPVGLQCEARGSPAPNITWFKDKQPIVSSARAAYAEGGRSLQLSRAQLSDAGLYICRASNIAGVAEKAVRLEVYGEASLAASVGCTAIAPGWQHWLEEPGLCQSEADGSWGLLPWPRGAAGASPIMLTPSPAVTHVLLSSWASPLIDLSDHLGQGLG
uniref:Ig-like domain-containing protein n=1 Tax=Chelonoidis abingdonii TaxID=106734 RepID=A0A8C0GAC8_CHEAB